MVFIRRHARHWRKYLAGGGLVLILAAEFLAASQPGTAHQSRNQNVQTASTPNTPADETSVRNSSGGYQPTCQRPQSREDAAYCDQRKATIAADAQATSAEVQIVISIVGIAAVVATLVVSIRATNASRNAADAAVRQAVVSEQQVAISISAQRAVIAYEAFTLSIQKTNDTQDTHWIIGQNWMNRGQTRAAEAEYYIVYDFMAPTVDNVPTLTVVIEKPGTKAIAAGAVVGTDHKVISGTELVEWFHRNTRLYVRTLFVYRDIFPGTPLRTSSLTIEYVLDVDPLKYLPIEGVALPVRGRVCNYIDT